LKRIKFIIFLIIITVMLMAFSACTDEHEGMVFVNTGHEKEWVPEAKGVPKSDFKKSEFYYEGNIAKYKGEGYITKLGIDVSEHQREIDWEKVKADGIEFALIRCGYRGYTKGNIMVDEFFEDNIKNARKAGLKIGIYFFSQATGAVEAAEEAQFVINLLKPYKQDISLPVAFDWEPMRLEGSRSAHINKENLTASALVFSEIIKDAGYTPMVYMFRPLGYKYYDLERVKDFDYWIGAIDEWPDFYYKHIIWQFSMTGTVDGIETEVDLNLMFEEIAPPESPESK
jgi:lysozyme